LKNLAAIQTGVSVLISGSESSVELLDLSRQQRNLLLLRPLFQLEFNKGRIGDDKWDEQSSLLQGIDTHYLALTALDVMMEGTTTSTGATSQEVLNKLTDVARKMKPDLTMPQANKVADVVLGALDNKTSGYKEFSLDYFDAAKGATRKVNFRLVSFEPDMEDVSRYKPTPEGYLVYLGMLDLAPEDSQELMEKMLDLLVQRGRFDAALEIARRARAYSIEYRQQIRDKLHQAYRAPGTVNWVRDIAGGMKKAREHVVVRQREDQRMLEAVREALKLADGPSRINLEKLLAMLLGASQFRGDLLRVIVGASDKFLEANQAIFRARRPSGHPDLESVLFPRALAMSTQELAEHSDDLIAALYPPQPFKVPDMNTLLELLLEPRRESIMTEADDGEIVPHVTPALQFEQKLIDEVTVWLKQQIDAEGQITLADLLERSNSDGQSCGWRRCLVFVAMRLFATEDSDLKGVQTVTLDDYISDISTGTNIQFEPKGRSP